VSARKLGATLALLATLASGALGCAGVPRPGVLGDVDRVRVAPAAVEAGRYAPDAFARAEKLRADAEAALTGGDPAGAQLLAERALAAYAHAEALARAARAAATTTESKAALVAAEAELGALDADQARVAADAEALELKLKVARDAQPIQPSGKADPEREKARVAAARALAMEARLLCAAARLLTAPGAAARPDAPLDEAEAALGKVEGELSAASIPAAPIDAATRARAGCLAALTAIRRAAAPTGRAPGVGDALLAELSAAGGFTPSRDDRGVTVVLRGVFAGGAGALTPQGEARLAELGKVAAAHPSFPVEIVVHTDRPLAARDEPAEKTRAAAAVRALLKTGGDGVRAAPLVAGNQAPLADPAGPDRARNARVEIVFITPEGF
jgi:flagellar motor protein MotB